MRRRYALNAQVSATSGRSEAVSDLGDGGQPDTAGVMSQTPKAPARSKW